MDLASSIYVPLLWHDRSAGPGRGGHKKTECDAHPSPQELAGLPKEQWGKVDIPADLPPPAYPAPCAVSRQMGAGGGRTNYCSSLAPAYGRLTGLQTFNRPPLVAQPRPLHSIAVYVHNTDADGLQTLMLDMEERAQERS